MHKHIQMPRIAYLEGQLCKIEAPAQAADYLFEPDEREALELLVCIIGRVARDSIVRKQGESDHD